MTMPPTPSEIKILSSFKEKLSQNFGEASDYDNAAYIQRKSASLLSDALKHYAIKPKNILEIGCGTGFLSEMLFSSFSQESCFHFTDLSSEMLKRTERKIQAHPTYIQSHQKKTLYYRMDGENPTPYQRDFFDLIASNLCIQWFTNHKIAFQKLTKHLAPQGILAVTTLLQGSLQEWRLSCKHIGAPCGVPLYPTLEEMQQTWDKSGKGKWLHIPLQEKTPSAFLFLKNLQKIGASLPTSEHRPLKITSLKRAMSYFDAHYNEVTYHIGLGLFQKDASSCPSHLPQF